MFSKYILGIGFVFSAMTSGGIGILYGVFTAPFTYVIGIILRAAGWIGLAMNLGMFYMITGVLVLILGTATLIFFATELVYFVIISWTVYSFLEFFSYFRLSKVNKIFLGAMMSIVSIIAINYLIFSGALSRIGGDILLTILPVFWIMAISAVIASIGCFKLKPKEVASATPPNT